MKATGSEYVELVKGFETEFAFLPICYARPRDVTFARRSGICRLFCLGICGAHNRT